MQQYNQNTVELSLAKPGVQRRKHDNEGRNEVPDDLLNELQNKSPPRATSTTETATSTSTTTRTEILQTRSPEREFGTPTGSSSSISRISSPEIIKLEPITVTSLEPSEYTSKPLFEIVMSPQDVMDLSTRSSPPRPSGGPFLVKRRISTTPATANETCDQDLKRQKLLHSNN